MSRTLIRTALGTIATAAVAAGASISLAAPSQAAAGDLFEDVRATWLDTGVVAGTPGNVHRGEIVVDEYDGRASFILQLVDYTCPVGVTDPSAGQCVEERSRAAQRLDDSPLDIAVDRHLSTATITGTTPVDVIVGGVWTQETIAVDLHLTGTGDTTREVYRQQHPVDPGWDTVIRLTRDASVNGTVADIAVGSAETSAGAIERRTAI